MFYYTSANLDVKGCHQKAHQATSVVKRSHSNDSDTPSSALLHKRHFVSCVDNTAGQNHSSATCYLRCGFAQHKLQLDCACN